MVEYQTLRACGLLLVGLALALSDEGEAEQPIYKRLDLPSIAACGGCHQAVWAEWSESLHARAWSNPNARAATRDFEKAGCRDCHSPRPMFETGLDQRPAYRDFMQEDGVHCLSCHGLPNGVAAARTIDNAPCRPIYRPEFLEARSCYPCHQPTHQAFDEYAESDASATGVRCVDCHMQPVTRARIGKAESAEATRLDGPHAGRSHGPHGGFQAAFVRKALAWEARIEEGRVRVELRNRTGHKFPGEIPSRVFTVRLEYPGHPPQVLQLRRPFRGEERADDRLRPDETRVLSFAPPPGAVRVRLRLLFAPLPLVPVEEAFLLGEWKSEL